MKTATAVLALAAAVGCAAPGGEPAAPLTDAEFRRMAIEEMRTARGGEVRGLRLTDLLRPPPTDPRR